LIHPLTCWSFERYSLLRRRCPECEHRDVVSANRLAAAVWMRRGDAARERMHALADALADGLPLEVDEVLRWR
jgi:hypothetical protein